MLKHTPRGIGRSVFELKGNTLHYRVATQLAGSSEFIPIVEGAYRRQS